MWDKGGGTRNHAWSGGPMITMSKYMAGVKPVIAGYDIYEITPDMGELNQVQVSVPSVKGAIDVAMQQDLAANTFSSERNFTSRNHCVGCNLLVLKESILLLLPTVPLYLKMERQ